MTSILERQIYLPEAIRGDEMSRKCRKEGSRDNFGNLDL